MRMRFGVGVLVGALMVGAAMADVAREGSGERREALDAMERAPMPAIWGDLTGWSSEEPIDEGDISGKVVLLVTWASWYPPSQRVLPLAERLYQAHAGDGLVVIGVHHPRGFERAASIAKARGVTFPIAHDAEGKVRETLRVDQDPDFYVIDRAGQLRYADIATGSVEDAVEELLAESREQAASLNERLEAMRRASEEAFRRTDAINQEVDLRNLPEIPFTPPSDRDWALVEDKWPEMPEDRRSRRGDTVRKVQLSETMQMRPGMPATKGRAMVLYFWHPGVLWTHQKTMRFMDELQKKKGRDLVVIGVLTPDSSRRTRRGEEDTFNDPLVLGAALERTYRTKNLAHTLAFDPTGSLMSSASGESRGRGGFDIRTSRGRNGNTTELGAPAAVVSSDGTVRWYGFSTDPAFIAAVDQVLRIDPGVKARRAAEEEYIRTNLKPGG